MLDENLEITQDVDGDICRLKARGRIDANSAAVLENKLDKALKDGQNNIVLNMAMVEYLSSVGIRIILKTYKQLSETLGSFKIESPSEIVKNVLGMAALKEMLVS